MSKKPSIVSTELASGVKVYRSVYSSDESLFFYSGNNIVRLSRDDLKKILEWSSKEN